MGCKFWLLSFYWVQEVFQDFHIESFWMLNPFWKLFGVKWLKSRPYSFQKDTFTSFHEFVKIHIKITESAMEPCHIYLSKRTEKCKLEIVTKRLLYIAPSWSLKFFLKVHRLFRSLSSSICISKALSRCNIGKNVTESKKVSVWSKKEL